MVYNQTPEELAALQREWLNEKVAAKVAALSEAVKENNQRDIKKLEKQVRLAKLLQEDGLVLNDPSNGIDPADWNRRTGYGRDIPSLKNVFDVVTETIITDQKAAEPDTVMPRLHRVADLRALLSGHVKHKTEVSGTQKELAMLRYEARENFVLPGLPTPDDIRNGVIGPPIQDPGTGVWQIRNMLYRKLKPDSRDWLAVKARCKEREGQGLASYQAPVTAVEDIIYYFVGAHIYPDKNGKLRHQGRISTMDAMRDGGTSEISTDLCKALIKICPCQKRKSKDVLYQEPALVGRPNKRPAGEIEQDAAANEFEQRPKRIRPNEQPPPPAVIPSMSSVPSLSISDDEDASPLRNRNFDGGEYLDEDSQSTIPNNNEEPRTPDRIETPEVFEPAQDILDLYYLDDEELGEVMNLIYEHEEYKPLPNQLPAPDIFTG